MLADINTKVIKGSTLLYETLKNLGVDTVFGYPGGIVLEVYDEFYKHNYIKHVLVRHEQSAVHAAEGYAKTTGKCGFVIVTSGPGATNTVTGITNAYLDGTPIVVLTGQVFSNLLGKDAFQEANICEMTKTCTKAVFQVKTIEQLKETIIEAHKVALSNRKGPVVVDIVKDVFQQFIEQAPNNVEVVNSSVEVSYQNYDRIISLISNSKKPVIVAGGGVISAKAEDDLAKFLSRTSIPVVNTMMGLGSINQEVDNYFGMVGIFGDYSANQIIKDSDLIISLGARFNDRIISQFKDIDISKKFVQIDINEKEIGNFIVNPLAYSITDIKNFICILNKNIGCNYSFWNNQAQVLKTFNKKRCKTTNLLHSYEVIREIERCTKNQELIFSTDVGQHQLWSVQNLKFNKNRKLLTSGGLGTMGYGLPAAIGAAFANASNPVVCITGDGSFQMSLQELATCVENNLNIKIFILNNGYLGMVRQLQEKFCEQRYSQTQISNPDFVKLAQSYGVEAVRVSSLCDIENAICKAFSNKSPYIVEFIIEPMELL